jgi:hypothetical protein
MEGNDPEIIVKALFVVPRSIPRILLLAISDGCRFYYLTVACKSTTYQLDTAGVPRFWVFAEGRRCPNLNRNTTVPRLKLRTVDGDDSNSG